MATLRQFLDSKKFDWSDSLLLLQPTTGYSPGWSGGAEIGRGEFVTSDDPRLDEEFDDGFGAPHCPRFFARDKFAVYFPTQYDGSTRCTRVVIDPHYYVTNPTPYPGG